MPNMEKVIKGLESCRYGCPGDECPYHDGIKCADMMTDALALLKEQEAVVKQWTNEIADNQLVHAPKDYPMSLDEQLENEYKRGIWDGLQIAWNIISEGR